MQNRQNALQVLQDHWKSWIVEDDFKQMRAAGLNHVRYVWLPLRSYTALTPPSHVSYRSRPTGFPWAIGQYPSHPRTPTSPQTHHPTYPGHGPTSPKPSTGPNPTPSTSSSTFTAPPVHRTVTTIPVRGPNHPCGPRTRITSRRL